MNNEATVGSITVGGQPTADELRSGRFGTVVNLRLPDEPGNTTATGVQGTNVAYHAVPLTVDTLSAEHIVAIRRALDAATGDVLIH